MNETMNEALEDVTVHVEIEAVLAAAWPRYLSSAQIFAACEYAQTVNQVSMSLSDKHRRDRVVRIAADPETHGPRVQFAYQLSEAALAQQRTGDVEAAKAVTSLRDAVTLDAIGTAPIEPALPPLASSAAPIDPPPADGQLEHWAIKGSMAQRAVDVAIAGQAKPATPWRAQITEEARAKKAAKKPVPKPKALKPDAPETVASGASLAAAAAAAAAAPGPVFRCALWSDGSFAIEGLSPRPMVDGVMRLAPPEIRAVIEYLESFDRRGRASEATANG